MATEQPDDDNPETQLNESNHLNLEGVEPDVEVAESSNCCFLCIGKCCRFFSTNYHPLSSDPSLIERIAFAFRCPTHGPMGTCLTALAVIACLYAILFVVAGPQLVLPGSCEPLSLENRTDEVKNSTTRGSSSKHAQKCSGQLFGLFALFVCAMLAGIAVSRWLPPLLGMMVVGFVLENVPYINVARTIDPSHSSLLRNTALCIILIRAGLGLDPGTLRKLSGAVFRLAFAPCLTETCVWGIVARFLLGMPFTWCFMCGFVLAAVSPAVVVPCMLRLEERRLGTNKGVPTLVIAAASVDDVLAITGFGVLLAMTFSSSQLVLTLFRGPLEALLGIFYGMVVGPLLWCIPHRKSSRFVFYRFLLLFGFALFGLIGSTLANVPGAGALGVLTISFVAGIGWRRYDRWSDEKNPLNSVFATLWWIAQPFLFGLIGAEVKLETLDVNKVAWGILTLFIGLFFRMIASFFAVLGTGLTLRERFFISIAWIPKATVQAAIGSVALDTAIRLERDDLLTYGNTLLTCAVLSILITAPLGALFIDFSAPRLLHQEPRRVAPEKAEVNEKSDEV